MATISIEGALYYDTSDKADLCWGTAYRWYPGKPQDFSETVVVCPLTITADIGSFDPRPVAIRALEEQRTKLRAAFEASITEIARRINELQAIELAEA
jgi:hypothetical protein